MHLPNRSGHKSTPIFMGVIALGLIGLVGCGPKESKSNQPNLVMPGLAQSPTPKLPPEPTADAPGLPKVHIQASDLVTAQTGGHRAEVFGDPGLTYEWFIQGGTLQGDVHAPSIEWTAGDPGELRLFCQGINADGKKTVALARVGVEAPPSIERFQSMPPVLTAGHTAKVSWTAKEIKSLTLDPGGKDVSQFNGPAMDVKPAETTVYTLTATNAAGATVTKTLEIKVVPPPTITSFRATGAINFGQPITLSAAFTGGKAEITKAGAVLTSGTTSPLQVTSEALKAGDSFTLTVTNEAGDSVTRTQEFNPPANPATPGK